MNRFEGLSFTADGRPILTGCATLPPMDEPLATNGRPSPNSKAKRNAANRFGMLNTFIDCTMRDLTPSEKLVWLVLFRDTKNGLAKSSQGYIAQRSGLTQSTVSQAIKRLSQRGLLKVVRQGGLRKGLSVYKIRGSV